MTNYCKKSLSQLKAQVKHLKKQNEQLRLLLHELIEAFYKSLNGNQKEPSTTWAFNPDLEQLFKDLANFKTNCSHQSASSSRTYPNECGWKETKENHE